MRVIRNAAMQLYQLAARRRFLTRLNALNRSQWLTRGELEKLQRQKLHRLLVYANANVPYYQRVFREVGFAPDDILSGYESFARIPLLTKAVIRQNFDDLLTTEARRRSQMSKLTTGGSIGQPLVFMQDNDFRDAVTADIHRHLGWAGWRLGDPHAYVWGANFEATQAQTMRVKLMDWALNRFVTNAYVLSDDALRQFAAEIKRKRPRLLFGYASSLYRFAQFARRDNISGIAFDGIFSSAETLFDSQRQFIEETFQSKIFNRYGTRELGGVACECSAHRGLHLSAENNYVEILRDNLPAKLAETGDIVVTNLNNLGMPFIRYAVEDSGDWMTDSLCECGRQQALMILTEGRKMHIFKTRSGAEVWGGFASPMFGMPGVKQFQVAQITLDLVIVRIVKEGDIDPARLAEIEKTVQLALGDNVQTKFEFVSEIPLRDSGKHLYTYSELVD